MVPKRSYRCTHQFRTLPGSSACKHFTDQTIGDDAWKCFRTALSGLKVGAGLTILLAISWQLTRSPPHAEPHGHRAARHG